MRDFSLKDWAALFAPLFEHWMPRTIDSTWVTRFVDQPRFGWDLAGLQAGFTDPLYRFVDALPIDGPPASMRHLRPALACRLVSVLSGDDSLAMRFDAELVALELHALASMMLDHLDNGRNLAASKGGESELALPVLITVAYSARQLAAALPWREGTLSGQRRARLAQRFSRLLMLQGIGHTLDLWGSERALRHGGEAALADHLRWYLAPLDFELVCELAAAVLDLSAERTQWLVEAGADLGLAWHCTRHLVQVSGTAPAGRRMDQPLRWSRLVAGVPEDALEAIASKARAAALVAAGKAGQQAATVFEEFLQEAAQAPAGQPDAEVAA